MAKKLTKTQLAGEALHALTVGVAKAGAEVGVHGFKEMTQFGSEIPDIAFGTEFSKKGKRANITIHNHYHRK